MMIGENSVVSLHFSLALEDGQLVDSTFDRQPATFAIGDGSLLPGFEKKLLGLAAGGRHEFWIEQQDAFGAHNPANVQRFPRSSFSGTELSEGLVVSFADAAGNELPGVVSNWDDKEVQVDFNHPLAGRRLLFTVEIINVG
ncbi:MAG TPA: peptidylprolyl isomerase [Pseudomonadales bacterium]